MKKLWHKKLKIELVTSDLLDWNTVQTLNTFASQRLIFEEKTNHFFPQEKKRKESVKIFMFLLVYMSQGIQLIYFILQIDNKRIKKNILNDQFLAFGIEDNFYVDSQLKFLNRIKCISFKIMVSKFSVFFLFSRKTEIIIKVSFLRIFHFKRK